MRVCDRRLLLGLLVALCGLVARVGVAAAGAPPFVEYAGTCTRPAWQPGGALLACTLDEPHDNVTRGGLLILGADAKERAFVLGPVGVFAWRPDGKLLVAASNRAGPSSLFFLNAEGKEGVLAQINRQVLEPLAWHPDGREVWFSFPATLMPGRTDISAVTADGSRTSLGSPEYCAGCSMPAFAVDGHLAAVEPTGTVVVTDRRPGHFEQLRFVFPPSKDPLLKDAHFMDGPRWSPDGRYLAVVTFTDRQGGTLQVLDTRTPGAKFVAVARSVGDVAWSPDGSEVATTIEMPPGGQPG